MKKLTHGILIGFAAAAIALALFAAGWLRWLEQPTWDLRARQLARPGAATEDVRLILIDQSSLDWVTREMGYSWPWPRTLFEPVVSFCRRSGARAVGLDILFTEPSPHGVEDDQALGAALAEQGHATAAFFPSARQGSATNWPGELALNDQPVQGLSDFLASPTGTRLRLPRAAFPTPDIANHLALLGSVYASTLEPGAVIRRNTAFGVFDERFVPALGIATFLAAHPEAPVRVEPRTLHVGEHRAPLDADGNVILRYRGPSQTHRTLNFSAVCQSELRIRDGDEPSVDPDIFRDRYVLVGVTAPALLDLKPTPISDVYPGVEIHATMLDNLLADDFIRDVPPWGTVGVTLLFALLCGALGRACRSGWHSAMAIACLLPLPFLPGFLAYRAGFWLPIAPSEVASVFALVGALVVNYAIEGRQKRFIRSAFRQYLSPIVIDRLLRDPKKLRLGGETRELSIYFSDIQGFTGISEGLTPQALTTLLNEYLTAMTDIILDEGGTVDKYEGDAIIAFWNAPLDQPDHAVRAVRAALRCQEKLHELAPRFSEQAGKALFARIGLNTGSVVVGNMGSDQRFDYTFLGDAGNLASRLEGINKQFGTAVMISGNMAEQIAPDFPAREISQVRVVGRTEPVRVFEPMQPATFAQRAAPLKQFADALKLYYDGAFQHALDRFSELADDDPVAAAYARRCRDLLDNAPPDWDGVWEMKEK